MPLATPTMTAATDDAAARVAITCTGTNPGVSVTLRFEVQRSTDGGTTWAAVRNSSTYPPNGSWVATIYDYEAPATGSVSYRARAIDIDGVPATPSTWTATATVTPDVAGWWLIDPEVPTLNTEVPVERAAVTIGRKRDQGVFAALGRSTAVVVSGDRRGRTIGLPILAVGNTIADKLDAIIDGGRTLMLRTADGRQWYVATPAEWAPTMQPTADWSERPIYKGTLTLVEVEAP